MVMQLVTEFWKILEQSAIFILLGFLFAAGLHALMARTRWAEWLQALNTKSVLLAAAIAAPLPLCSCSVIPAAISLRKRGASKGAVLSFLISAPETNVESITFTWGLLGPVFAIFRPIAGLITALTAGITENFFERRFPSPALTAPQAAGVGVPGARSCCGSVPASVPTCWGSEAEVAPGPAEAHACCADQDVLAGPQRITWRDGLRHAFVDVFDSVVGWMLFGVAAAAVINVLIPGYVIDAVFGPPLQAMLVMLAIGIPLYVCAEASTPIAAALILQGVNPGAALVFLLAGPATNIGSIIVLARHLGRRTIVIYLVSIAVVAVAMGLVLDWLFVIGDVKIQEHVMSTPLVSAGFKTAGAVLFVVLAVFSAVRQRFDRRIAALLDGFSPVRVTPRRLVVGLMITAVAGYAASGFVIVEPGQVGMIKRFGRVVAAEVPPGLHWAGPYPMGNVDRIDTRQVYRLELGAVAATAAGSAEEDRAWVLLGDENIANIKCAAHWRMTPGAVRAFAYGTADREKLVACALRSALRNVLGGANIETVFTTEQVALAEAVHGEAQQVLDENRSGIELLGFHFLDLHAPPEVHEAFRDVASALEDRVTRRNQALARQAEIQPLALGTRDKLVGAAQADALRIAAEAAGEADAFIETLAAYREFPDLTRMRAVFEMYDRILPGRRKFIRPTALNLQLDLRFGGEKKEDAGTP